MDEVLFHHGIKGMKWGVRRTPEQLGHRTKNSSSLKSVFKKKTKPEKSSQEKQTPSKPVKKLSELSDSELRDKINRLELERRYSDLLKSENKPKVSRGKKFVSDVIESSGKNIATQLTTYAFGAMVNKVAGKEIVNPKKGQKDK